MEPLSNFYLKFIEGQIGPKKAGLSLKEFNAEINRLEIKKAKNPSYIQK